ncbi:TPA: LuxR C-terminal-related transcriptional regulator [Salmonella enterica]
MVLRFRETDILTPTEMEIVYYLLRGFSLTQIAYTRERSIKTLSVHKRNICRKLGSASTATLLLALLDKNIVTLHRYGRDNVMPRGSKHLKPDELNDRPERKLRTLVGK